MVPSDLFPKIGVSVIDAALAAGFAESRTQARKMIESGGFRINGEKTTDFSLRLVMMSNELLLIKERK